MLRAQRLLPEKAPAPRLRRPASGPSRAERCGNPDRADLPPPSRLGTGAHRTDGQGLSGSGVVRARAVLDGEGLQGLPGPQAQGSVAQAKSGMMWSCTAVVT